MSLRTGAVGQNHGVHFSGRVTVDFVAEKRAGRLEAAAATGSGYSIWGGQWVVCGLVGAISPRHAWAPFRTWSYGTDACRQPRDLVLPQQTLLAVISHIYLSAMDNQGHAFPRLWMVDGLGRSRRDDLPGQTLCGTRCRSGSGIL